MVLPVLPNDPKWEKELKSRNIDWKAKFNNIAKICHVTDYENSI